jgi:hypothetical protein
MQKFLGLTPFAKRVAVTGGSLRGRVMGTFKGRVAKPRCAARARLRQGAHGKRAG